MNLKKRARWMRIVDDYFAERDENKHLSINAYAKAKGLHVETMRRWCKEIRPGQYSRGVAQVPDEIKLAIVKGYINVRDNGHRGAVTVYLKRIRDTLGCSSSAIRIWLLRYENETNNASPHGSIDGCYSDSPENYREAHKPHPTAV